MSEDTSSGQSEWAKEHEQILVEWADKAMCYRWLHSKSHAMYNWLNAWYTVPVIIISTLTGTANFAQERVPLGYQYIFTMAVGGFNILAGIISTIQQFLKITQLNESHRVAAIAWDKFYRNIKIELAKHPRERTNVMLSIKQSKEEFDRLMETSPSIPEKIVNQFKESIRKSETDGLPKIVKPEICDELISSELSRNQWINNDVKRMDMVEDQKNRQIEEFKRRFIELHSREPLLEEIRDNMVDVLTCNV